MLGPQPMACLSVHDASMAVEARRIASALAEQAGLDTTRRGRAAIIASELASNLAKHPANGGMLILQIRKDKPGLEIIAIDKGPGMEDMTRCLRDGYSTSGSSGNGLGAITRLSDEFDIFSRPESGTVVYSFLAKDASRMAVSHWDVGAISLPYPGEVVCGDGWAMHADANRLLIMTVDGLGHGLAAEQAAKTAEEVFAKNVRHNPKTLMAHLHEGLNSTRGAAAAVAEILLDDRKIRYCGIGNIASYLLHGEGSKSLVSFSGTVGHTVRKLQEFLLEWGPNRILVMHSDGLRYEWDIEKYPGLALRRSAVIAAVLMRDFIRGKDDVTVVVARHHSK